MIILRQILSPTFWAGLGGYTCRTAGDGCAGRSGEGETGRKGAGSRAEAGVASDEMCTFLIMNISSLQLIPVNVIAYRSQYGSVNPAGIVGAGIVATAVRYGGGYGLL